MTAPAAPPAMPVRRAARICSVKAATRFATAIAVKTSSATRSAPTAPERIVKPSIASTGVMVKATTTASSSVGTTMTPPICT